ncbi:sensor histidine kinase [Candidatus Cloacimonadota bacterium]
MKSNKLNQQFIDNTFLEALDEWVWEMDLDGIHTYSNGAVKKILGYDVDEVVGFSTKKLWTKINKESQLESLRKSLAEGVGWKNFAAYFVHKDGTIKILLSSAVPIYDEAGKLNGYRGIDRDITERVMSENFLKSQKEHIKLVNQILRHDIANDLAVINSSIRLYESSNESTYLDEIKSRLKKSLKLIHSMREQESFILDENDLQVFSVQDVIAGIIKDIKEVEINVNGNSHFLADRAIYSVFENLISNAIIHGGANKIKINITKEKFKCIVSVEDNGKGIPDEIKGQLFEEGFKFGFSGNTGLGLYIVKQAMKKYKGDISVEDNYPCGAKFILTFHKLGNT